MAGSPKPLISLRECNPTEIEKQKSSEGGWEAGVHPVCWRKDAAALAGRKHGSKWGTASPVRARPKAAASQAAPLPKRLAPPHGQTRVRSTRRANQSGLLEDAELQDKGSVDPGWLDRFPVHAGVQVGPNWVRFQDAAPGTLYGGEHWEDGGARQGRHCGPGPLQVHL